MPYPIELIQVLASKHGVVGEPVLLPDGGMVNEAWRIGEDAILRIVRLDNDAECDEEPEREALIVPLARSAGVRTPELLAMGPAGEGHRPYTIYEFVKGEVPGYLQAPVESFRDAYVELGEQLAKLHAIVVPDDVRKKLRGDRSGDPHRAIDKALEGGVMSGAEADEMRAWITRLQEIGGTGSPVLVHNDIHSWNLMVEPPSPAPGERGVGGRGLAAILDWGDAAISDPAEDFSAIPLQAVPPMLEGYEAAGGKVDDALIARSLVRGLRTGLWEMLQLPEDRFIRHWWRMPPDGWPELKTLILEFFPHVAPK